MRKLCAIVAVLSVVLCATQAAPLQTDDASVYSREIEVENYAFRSLLEQWIKGDIGLRKSLKDLAGLVCVHLPSVLHLHSHDFQGSCFPRMELRLR